MYSKSTLYEDDAQKKKTVFTLEESFISKLSVTIEDFDFAKFLFYKFHFEFY